MPFLGERVGMTEAARLHFDSDLSRPGLRNLSLDHLKRSTRATHLDDAHFGHPCSPRTTDSLSFSPYLHTTIDDDVSACHLRGLVGTPGESQSERCSCVRASRQVGAA